jgi:hypothetical protein
MIDHPPPKPGGTMDANEIALRLKNLKGAKTQCPQCERTKWAEPGEGGRAILTVTNGEITEDLPLIILICDNCGFVRLHNETRLHD